MPTTKKFRNGNNGGRRLNTMIEKTRDNTLASYTSNSYSFPFQEHVIYKLTDSRTKWIQPFKKSANIIR